MTTQRSIEPEHTLLTAVTRLDALRTRESLAGFGSDAEPLDRTETPEPVALSAVIARTAAYGRPPAHRPRGPRDRSLLDPGSAPPSA
ncbi:hypothetical protein [Streptomyces sp. NPDC059272]|uniref:hypothetical protein n=1 Tax=Streptomyces sp. NPDC059272 TaxID=3346800 RepID=UPI00367738A5